VPSDRTRPSLAHVRQPVRDYVSYIERQNRIWGSRSQGLDELYEGSFDAQGIANRVGPLVIRDKNFVRFFKFVHSLASLPQWKPRNFPDAEPLGFENAITAIEEVLPMEIEALWLSGPMNPLQVQDKHAAMMYALPPRSEHLILPATRAPSPFVRDGRRTRTELILIGSTFAAGPSIAYSWELSKETQIEPVDAERKPYSR
jgi:hypothetical protein